MINNIEVSYEKINWFHTLVFRVGNVNFNELIDYMKETPNQFFEYDSAHPLIRCIGFFDLVKKAKERGELDLDMPDYIRMDGTLQNRGTAIVNTIRLRNVYGADIGEVTKAEIKARKQVYQIVDFLRKYAPGFKIK